MTFDAEELKLILTEGEGYLIEFKEAVSDSLAKEMVALANSSGGRIFVGIDDDGHIKGVKVTNRLKSRVQDLARNCDPPVAVSLEEWDNVLVVKVREGADKPYACREGFFIRVGPNSQKLRRDEIIEYFAHEGRIRFDEQYCMEFNYPEDFSQKRFDEYLARCGITSNLPTEHILKNLGVAQRQGDRLLFKNAGVLLFAREPMRFHFHALVTCVRFRGKTKTYIIDRKDFDEDVISNVESGMKWLKTYVPIRYEIGGGKLARDEIPALPYEALREALLNSVTHRDYFEKGAVTVVEYYDDRVVISNPGGLVKALRPEEFGLTSVSRNPLLQGLFHRADLVERIGSGIGRMRADMEALGLEGPDIDWNSFYRITFRGLLVEEEEEEVSDTVNGTVRGTVKFEGDYTDRLILELIKKGEVSRSPDLVNIVNIPLRTAKRRLGRLVKEGMINFEGPSKTGCYVITSKGTMVIHGFADDTVNGTGKHERGDRDIRILELIKKGDIVRSPDAVRILKISSRTAKRHLAALVENHCILFEGPRKTGKYIITKTGEQFLGLSQGKED